MKNLYKKIVLAKAQKRKLLAVLLDPEKMIVADLKNLCIKINKSIATHIFIGGSTFNGENLDQLIFELKKHTTLPVILFPGDYKQISNEADAILFLSLLSGRNPDYLIEHQVQAVIALEQTNLEVIPTAYLLIESGIITAVERVSNTKPLDANNWEKIAQTAKAGEYLGNKLVYLEAGSGAKNAVTLDSINQVAKRISIPLIVGGGIRSKKAIDEAFKSGADMVVIGTAFENDITFFEL